VEEGIMEFLAQNWFYIIVLILFVAMHLVGSGCGHTHKGHKHAIRTETDERSAMKDGIHYR
jgi:hypothetical protein